MDTYTETDEHYKNMGEAVVAGLGKGVADSTNEEMIALLKNIAKNISCIKNSKRGVVSD